MTAPTSRAQTYAREYIRVGGRVIAIENPAGSSAAVLGITKTHVGSFIRGQQHAAYTVTVSNAANAGATTGTVTVTDTVPSGVTLVSMAGTGWSCPAGNNCTRSDVLNSGARYPPITVTVNVAATAPSQLTNQVTVSGGGSATASASDTTAIIAPSDFDGNGVPDLVWHNDTTGQIWLWYMGGAGGATELNSAYVTGQSGWHVVAVADFNADGVPDLVWQNDTTRQVLIWYMGGAGGKTMQNSRYADPTGQPGWHVVAAADFNGDGVPDLVWQNDSSRQVTVWYMGGPGGATFQSYAYLDSVGQLGWHVVAAADFNSDGVPDLVWQNDTSRQVTVWYMGGVGGATFLSWAYLDSVGHPGWYVAAAVDFDGNGVPDLVWQNDSTRQVTVWYMGGPGGATFLSYAYLDSVGHPGWSLAHEPGFPTDVP